MSGTHAHAIPRERRPWFRWPGRDRAAIAEEFGSEEQESVAEAIAREPEEPEWFRDWRAERSGSAGGPASLAPLYAAPAYLGETSVDIFGHKPRRYVPPGAVHQDPPRPPMTPLPPVIHPRTAARGFGPVAAALMAIIEYPEARTMAPDLPRQYAAVMRFASALTGTTSPLEDPAAWPRRALEAGGGS